MPKKRDSVETAVLIALLEEFDYGPVSPLELPGKLAMTHKKCGTVKVFDFQEAFDDEEIVNEYAWEHVEGCKE